MVLRAPVCAMRRSTREARAQARVTRVGSAQALARARCRVFSRCVPRTVFVFSTCRCQRRRGECQAWGPEHAGRGLPYIACSVAHSAAWVSAAGRLPVLAVRLHGAAGATRGPLESPRADDASAGGKRSADWRCSKGDADCLRASGGFLRAGSTQGRAASGARRVTAERRVIDLRVRRGSLPASCAYCAAPERMG